MSGVRKFRYLCIPDAAGRRGPENSRTIFRFAKIQEFRNPGGSIFRPRKDSHLRAIARSPKLDGNPNSRNNASYPPSGLWSAESDLKSRIKPWKSPDPFNSSKGIRRRRMGGPYYHLVKARNYRYPDPDVRDIEEVVADPKQSPNPPLRVARWHISIRCANYNVPKNPASPRVADIRMGQMFNLRNPTAFTREGDRSVASSDDAAPPPFVVSDEGSPSNTRLVLPVETR